MSTSDSTDSLWDIAWKWVVREHEQDLDAPSREQLLAWLSQDPEHRKVYEEACRVWLISGLVPPADATPH
jgi:ferric-dicitrate binding protein FerR (iron transport regulator)